MTLLGEKFYFYVGIEIQINRTYESAQQNLCITEIDINYTEVFSKFF